MDVSTSSCQTGVDAGNQPVPQSNLHVRSPEPGADEPQALSTPEACKAPVPVVARIPDVEAEELWDEQAASRSREGRLISQKLSLKLLAAGALLLVAAAVTPFFWSRGSSDPKGTGNLPDWHPGPPAPTAEMAPSWKPSTVPSAQAGAEPPAPSAEIGVPANTPFPGSSPAGSSGWPTEPTSAKGLAGFAPPSGPTPEAQTPATPPDDPRLHVLSPPGARYGSASDAGDHMQGQHSAQASPGGLSGMSHCRSQPPPRGEWAGTPAPASNPGVQSYPQYQTPGEQPRVGGGAPERYPQRERYPLPEIPQYPGVSGSATGHPSAGHLPASGEGRAYGRGTAAQPRYGAEQSSAGGYPAVNTQPALNGSQAGLPFDSRYSPPEKSASPAGVDPVVPDYPTSQGRSPGNTDPRNSISTHPPTPDGYLPAPPHTHSNTGAGGNYPGGTGVPYGSGSAPAVPDRGQWPGAIPSSQPRSRPYVPAGREPDASRPPAGQSGAYAPNSYAPIGLPPSGAAMSSGAPAAVADRRGSVAPYEPYRRGDRDSSTGYSPGYRAEHSGTYPANGSYPGDYQHMAPGSSSSGSGAARLEGIIERPNMGTRY